MLAVLIGVAVGVTVFVVNANAADVFDFPQNFKFGAASASYQIEGAWDEDGKSPNIWDTVTHNNPGYVKDRSNGDVAADSYHMYEKDIEALDNIGVSALTGLIGCEVIKNFPLFSLTFIASPSRGRESFPMEPTSTRKESNTTTS